MARKRRHIELPLEIKILVLNSLLRDFCATKRELATMCLVWRDAAPLIRAYVFHELVMPSHFRDPTCAVNALVEASYIAPIVLSANCNPSFGAVRGNELPPALFPRLIPTFVNLTTLICSNFKDINIDEPFCRALSLLPISTLKLNAGTSISITKLVDLIAAVSAHLKALHIEWSAFDVMPFIVERWNSRNQLVVERDATSAESYELQFICQGLSLDLETLHFVGLHWRILEFFSDDNFSPVCDVHTLSMDMMSGRIVDVTQKLMARFPALETLEISDVDYDVATQLDISQVKHLRFNVTLVTSQGGCTLWQWHLRALEKLSPHSSLRSIEIQITIDYSEPFDVAFPQPVLWDSLDCVLCAENLARLEKLTLHVVYDALKDAEKLKEMIEHWLLVRCLPLTYDKYFLPLPPKGLVTFRDERPAPIV